MDRLGRLFGVAAMLATASIAQPVFAADLALPAVKDPPIATVNWTGFYLGGGLGTLFTDAHFIQPGSGLQEISLGTIDGRAALGLYGGFNYQITPWAVLGVEGSFNWFSEAFYRELGFQVDFLQQTRYVDAVTARAGLLWRPDTMIYAKVGPAWVDAEGVSGLPPATFHQNLLGVQGGVGVESFVTRNITVRAELSYTYASQLSLNQGTSLYRPAYLLAEVGAAYKFDAPAGWGDPAPLRPMASPFVVDAPWTSNSYAPHWGGFEAGGFGSLNGNQMKFTDTLGATPGGVLGPFTDLTVGGGWFFGANYQFQRVVVGAEISGNYENANFNTAAAAGGATMFFHFAQVDRALAFTGRIGWLMTPDTLLYVKAGPSNMRMTPDARFWNAIAPNVVGGTTLAGYVAGVGIETFVLPNVSLRAEALYTHTDQIIVLNGVVPNEFTLQPSIFSATIGAALHL